jgi:GNAT superfamily N-acetyltransferase
LGPSSRVVACHDGGMRVEIFDGDREDLRPLFREADDSDREIDGYLSAGEILVAADDSGIAGHLQLVSAGEGTAELKSMAVVESRRGGGVGRVLVEAALQWCRDRGVRRLAVATAAADTGNLRFYQRQGFRMLRIERDAFGPDTGYADGIIIDGIPLRDRVWLDQDV